MKWHYSRLRGVSRGDEHEREDEQALVWHRADVLGYSPIIQGPANTEDDRQAIHDQRRRDDDHDKIFHRGTYRFRRFLVQDEETHGACRSFPEYEQRE